MNSKNKRQYINPQCEMIIANMENIMFQASPGVGEDYNDDMVLDAKGYEGDIESAFMSLDGRESPVGEYSWEY